MDHLFNEVKVYLGPNGKMEQGFPGFTFRKEQLLMAEGICNAFTEDEFMVAEVGTGVGKTFAYLIPAVLWATQRKEKVVVSTRTKALQQQIVDRDLPDLARIMDGKIKYAEAKGRENYLCWNKYMQILAGKKRLETEEQDFIAAILKWAESTRSGDRKELSIASEMMKSWSVIAADRNNCLRDQCRYHDKCFRIKMIRNMEKADIIVVNHALLLSDILVENSILPEYENLIVDEAHSFIKESFDRLSFRFAYYEIINLLKILYEKPKKGGSRGYLLHLKSSYPHIADLIGEASTFTERAISISNDIFQRLSKLKTYGEQYNYHHIISPRDQEKEPFMDAIDSYREWQNMMNLLLDKLQEIKEELSGEEDWPELVSIITAMQEVSNSACLIIDENVYREDGICWLEYERGRVVALCSSPIYTGDTLNQKLYEKLKTLVMVSATMTVDNSFTNFINRSGLEPYADQGRLSTLMENSPFDYEKQAAIYVVRDMPDPGSSIFTRQVNQALAELLLQTGGRTMVLFTARKQMEEAAAVLRPILEARNLQLLVQNQDGEFGTLMERFTSNERAILMGLETFWEGIDLKGDLLKCLVIVKLPFRSPSDPYCTAWDKYYQLQRKSGFEFFMLPDATIRFKQGVGRLIRSEADRGVVVVLDTRLINKKYGRVMRDSLPIKNIAAVDSADLIANIKVWL